MFRRQFLDTIDGGQEGGEDVESYIKRQDDFSATVAAQEERMAGFVETADRLLQAGHPEAESIQASQKVATILKSLDLY